MTGLGNMLWRIGEILDFDAQVEWTRAAGLDGVGFHACVGTPGRWRGLEPAEADEARRAAVAESMSAFSYREIHAPFAIHLTIDDLDGQLKALTPVLQLAADLDVSVVTVHAQIGDELSAADRAAWRRAMAALDEQAARAQTTIGLEINDGFDEVIAWNLPRIGVTLDVGHMYAPAQADVLPRHGGLGGLVRHLGPALVHLHLHDTDGDTDHFEVGTGIVDFEGLAEALAEIGYPHNATLEMNPDRCSPEGIVRGATHLRALFDEAGLR